MDIYTTDPQILSGGMSYQNALRARGGGGGIPFYLQEPLEDSSLVRAPPLTALTPDSV